MIFVAQREEILTVFFYQISRKCHGHFSPHRWSSPNFLINFYFVGSDDIIKNVKKDILKNIKIISTKF